MTFKFKNIYYLIVMINYNLYWALCTNFKMYSNVIWSLVIVLIMQLVCKISTNFYYLLHWLYIVYKCYKWSCGHKMSENCLILFLPKQIAAVWSYLKNTTMAAIVVARKFQKSVWFVLFPKKYFIFMRNFSNFGLLHSITTYIFIYIMNLTKCINISTQSFSSI